MTAFSTANNAAPPRPSAISPANKCDHPAFPCSRTMMPRSYWRDSRLQCEFRRYSLSLSGVCEKAEFDEFGDSTLELMHLCRLVLANHCISKKCLLHHSGSASNDIFCTTAILIFLSTSAG